MVALIGTYHISSVVTKIMICLILTLFTFYTSGVNNINFHFPLLAELLKEGHRYL